MLQILRIGMCAFGILLCNHRSLSQTGTHDGFELVRSEDNIRVFERWVTFPGSDPPVLAREVKSEFYIKTDVSAAIALIRDESRIGSWQHHVSEFKVYPHNDSLWYEYSYHDIPWPVSDQDHFLEYTVKRLVDNDGTFITFRTVENKAVAPLRKNVSRMTLSGSWYLQPAGNGTIKATYRILSMPGPLPRFVTDPVIRNNLMTTVRSYIDILEQGYR